MFFLIYTLMLMLSGIATVVVGLVFKEQSTFARIASIVVGLALFCYGFYLMFIFDGGEYRIFFYVFILPILLIVGAVKGRKQAREQAAAQQVAGPAQPGYPAQPGQPQEQPGQPTV